MINLSKLTKTFSSKNPSGIDLRIHEAYRTKYYEVKDARNKARAIERKNLSGESDADPLQCWMIVDELASELLMHQTKDLEIASWLTEAWFRRYGFNGLQQGFTLIFNLLNKFSDSVYPLPDEDGIETRLASLVGLNGSDNNGSLIQPILNQYVTQGNSCGPFALWQYQQALELNKIKDPNILESKIRSGAIDINLIRKAVRETSEDFYQDLKLQMSGVYEIFDKLQKHLIACYGNDAPPYSNIKNTLELFDEHIDFLIKEANYTIVKPAPKKEVKKENKAEIQEIKPEVSKKSNSSTMTRESALSELAAIADFFKSTEPHSPISYSIERTIRWGNMSLPELMQELIRDDNAKAKFLNLTGLPEGNFTK